MSTDSRPRPRRGGRRGRRLLTGLALGALSVAVTGTAPVAAAPAVPAAPAQVADTITVDGRGWGHGRGMGQYGALGYSQAPFNWDSNRILQHYYGGTTFGEVGDPPLHVVMSAPGATTLTGLTGATTVRLDRGTPLVSAGGPLTPAPQNEVRIRRTAPNTFAISYRSTTNDRPCQGPWGPETVVGGIGHVAVLPRNGHRVLDDMLQLCDGEMAGGRATDRRYVQGELRAVSSATRQYSVNVVPLDTYLQGVVPRESPASWPAAALQAQSVAARSYALADARGRGATGVYPFVATCDTISCQVYGGQRQVRSGTASAAHPNTDAAIAATRGRVILRGGQVARAEFSSSTGGHTAGGDYPAVPDEGDAVAANPNHTWQATVPRSRIEASFAEGRGRLTGLEVTRRNGFGADGGRVLEVRLSFTGGTRTVTGNQFRSAMGLRSDWFSFAGGAAPRFSDIAGNTHEAAIDALADRGIVLGGGGRFRPDDPVTRGQVAAMFARAYAYGGTHPGFCDTAGHTFEREIRALAAAGITGGDVDGCFRPDATLTRGQAASFTARAEQLGGDGPGFCDTAGTTHDVAIRRASAAGITSGFANGCFRPDDAVTRGQLASFLARALDLV